MIISTFYQLRDKSGLKCCKRIIYDKNLAKVGIVGSLTFEGVSLYHTG